MHTDPVFVLRQRRIVVLALLVSAGGITVNGCEASAREAPAKSAPQSAAMGAGAAGAPATDSPVAPTVSAMSAPVPQQAPAAMPSAPAAPMAQPAPPASEPVGGAAQPGMPAADPPAAAAMATGSAEPQASGGCSGSALMPGRTMLMIESGGVQRRSIVYLPAGYDGKTPLPVLVDLHGFSSSGAGAESGSGFRQLADGEKFIYVAPDGINSRWEAIEDDDTTFIRALVSEIGTRGCIDLRRVYSTGCSNGGGLTFLLACTAEDVFAAVAPMCGTSFVDIETECMMDRPVPMMLVLGRSDALNCWEGTTQSLMPGSQPGRTVNVPCAKHVQKVFSEKYACKGMIERSDDGICESVSDCAQGSEVVICGTNTGHVVYSPAVARRAWDFLKRFHKP